MRRRTALRSGGSLLVRSLWVLPRAGSVIVRQTSSASGPETRRIEMADLPLPVAGAKMVGGRNGGGGGAGCVEAGRVWAARVGSWAGRQVQVALQGAVSARSIARIGGEQVEEESDESWETRSPLSPRPPHRASCPRLSTCSRLLFRHLNDSATRPDLDSPALTSSRSSSMSAPRFFIDFAAGDAEAYEQELIRHQELVRWLEANATKYGLAARLEALDEAARESLVAVYEGETQVRPLASVQLNEEMLTASAQIALTPSAFSPPASLLLPRLYLDVSSSPGLKKTSANFLALLTDDKKLVSKRAPNPPLRYRGTPVFRIDKGFVAQTGDVTRQDGSGGESICASKPFLHPV